MPGHVLVLPLHAIFATFLVSLAYAAGVSDTATPNPFTPRASALRYWDRKIRNKLTKPKFLIDKLSPLSATQWAVLQKLADQNALSTQLPAFCSWARLLCFPDTLPGLSKNTDGRSFVLYGNRNFTNIGNGELGGWNSFNNYSDNENIAASSFARYGRDSLNHTDGFSNYAPDSNVATAQFSSYAISGLGGRDDFINYMHGGNVPDIKFGAYSSDAVGNSGSFSSYSGETNSGGQSFRSYGKHGLAVDDGFNSYGVNSNVIQSSFFGYGELGNSGNSSFKTYGLNGNNPSNNFHGYGTRANAGVHSFSGYRDESNVGDDTFTSYVKNSNGVRASFSSYGNSFNGGSDKFTGYGDRAANQDIGFKRYGRNTTFAEYTKKESTSFESYSPHRGISSNGWKVEEGKFFRESKLKEGTRIKMPDIADKMPPRSFLPRSIARKLPFSSSRVGDLLKLFKLGENSTMAGIVRKTMEECERSPSPGETKRCVASAEDMSDFAVEVLGDDVTVKSTDSLGGSKLTVEMGKVVGINGGRMTKSVSCHQSLFPHLVYFCHSVPNVRVYEADLLDPQRKLQLNRGVALCHIDTSMWAARHAAFVALGGGPGHIEVCHWIYQNDMTWVIAH